MMHRHQPLIRHALMRANLQAGHTTSSAAGDDSARHKTAIVRNVCIIGFSGLEHFERPYIRCGFYQDRPSLRVIRQFSINKKRITIRNNAINTSFCTLVDIVVIRRTFNF